MILKIDMPHRTRIAPEQKAKAVLRLLAGESRETLATELGISASRIARWEELFVEGGQSALRKDSETKGRGLFYRNRKQIAQWAFLILALLAATLFLTRFMTTGEG